MPDLTITSADGTKLAARRSGRGSPLVLVHGATGDLDTFALIEGALAKRHTVWVYSRRGRGGSGDGADYGLQREVEDVLAVLAATGDRAHLVGHSGGALYCLLAAMQTRSLRSLVLYEPPLRLDNIDDPDWTFIDDMQSALDAGDPDRALELFFPVAGIVEQEIERPSGRWTRYGRGSKRASRSSLASSRLGWTRQANSSPRSSPPPSRCSTCTARPRRRRSSRPLDEVTELLPKAQQHGLARQRHLTFAFDPTTFAQAVLAFTTSHGE